MLDGEIAVFDKALVSRFEWLRGRPKDDAATPPIFIADCLFARGKDLRERALRLRRNVLEENRRRSASSGAPGAPARRIQKSLYVGGRTLKWLKVKQPRYRAREGVNAVGGVRLGIRTVRLSAWESQSLGARRRGLARPSAPSVSRPPSRSPP